MARKKKMKVELDDKGNILSFVEDGVDEREYLIIITSFVFFGGVALGLLITLIGMFIGYDLPPQYLELIGVMSSPLMVILGGIFTVKTAQVITDKKKESKKEESDVYDDSI